MALKPITISFKNTPEDEALYKWIICHSNLSGFIKDILKSSKESEVKSVKSPIEVKETGLIDIDF